MIGVGEILKDSKKQGAEAEPREVTTFNGGVEKRDQSERVGKPEE